MLPNLRVPDSPPATSEPWLSAAGGKLLDQGEAVTTDGAGDVYVAGVFGFSVKPGPASAGFGGKVLSGSGGGDVFVSRLNRTGKFIWRTSAGGPAWDEARSIAVDSTGNVYVAGLINYNSSAASNNPVIFGSITLTPRGGADGFVARLSPTGAWSWVAQIGGSGDDYALSVATDGSGVWVSGSFRGTVQFGGTKLVAKGETDIYVVRLDTAGKVVRAAAAGGSGRDEGVALALDSVGNAYAAGGMGPGPVKFGGLSLSSGGGTFVAKLDPKGTFVQVEAGGGFRGPWRWTPPVTRTWRDTSPPRPGSAPPRCRPPAGRTCSWPG